MKPQSDRAIFANQLRGLAVLAVMIVHWCGVFWYERELVATYIFADPVSGPPSRIMEWLSIPTVNYGPLGVSVFFLISGFVIPFSLARNSPLRFLASRAFRIYPTYFAGTALLLLSTWLSSRYWGKEFSVDPFRLLTNLGLVYGNLGQTSIDLVNWSLSIEIKFYIIAALLYKQIREGSLSFLAMYAVLILAFCEWHPASKDVIAFDSFSIYLGSIKTELICVIYMMIGTGFYHHFVGNARTSNLIVFAISMFLLFALAISHSEWTSIYSTVTQNYLYGLIIFSTAYCFRSKFRPFLPLDFLAKVSYPLYIVHSITGYAIIRALMSIGLEYYVALPVAFGLVIGMAYLLHVTVESKTMHLWKRKKRTEDSEAIA